MIQSIFAGRLCDQVGKKQTAPPLPIFCPLPAPNSFIEQGGLCSIIPSTFRGGPRRTRGIRTWRTHVARDGISVCNAPAGSLHCPLRQRGGQGGILLKTCAVRDATHQCLVSRSTELLYSSERMARPPRRVAHPTGQDEVEKR